MRPAALLLLCALGATAAEPATDPLLRLPAIPRGAAVAAEPFGEATTIAPGIATTPTAVVLDGEVLVDHGPVDGLEVIACLEGGKYHEALVRLRTGNGQLVKFAVIKVLGLDDGQPAGEASGEPARGTPVRVLVQWQSPDDAKRWLQADASTLVRDRVTDAAYPALPFVYTGSRIMAVTETAPDGKPVRRERFMLDATKSVAVAFDEPDALIASPFPGADTDQRFEANSSLAPPARTAARLVIARAQLPLTLTMDAAGGLRAGDGPALDDAGLRTVLAGAFGGDAAPALRAVGVRVTDPATDRQVDRAVRARLLAAAAEARVWAVPVFTLGP